jgi:hypothetical protein
MNYLGRRGADGAVGGGSAGNMVLENSGGARSGVGDATGAPKAGGGISEDARSASNA